MTARKRYDVIVAGVGAMGSAACWQLAKRGARVLGIEQYVPGHDRGSSHGETRLIRRAYFEDPAYVPLAQRAYELWDELVAASGRLLLHRIGLVIYGRETAGGIVAGVRRSAALHDIPVTACGALPGLTPPSGFAGVLEPGAGYLAVEDCVIAAAEQARSCGATIKTQTTLRSWRSADSGVEVETSDGQFFAADRLVVTAGAWTARALPDLASRLAVHRVPLFWFRALRPDSPKLCFGFELDEGFFYGVPDVKGTGVKVGLHVAGELVSDPARVDRDCRQGELEIVRTFVRRCLPDVDANALVRHAVCLYTMTRDTHFIIDQTAEGVVYAAGFSGHGFKFASVIGEILADLALDGRTRHPIDFLRYRWRDDQSR